MGSGAGTARVIGGHGSDATERGQGQGESLGAQTPLNDGFPWYGGGVMKRSGETRARQSLKESRKVVVKVGSRALASSPNRIRDLSGQLEQVRKSGRQVVLVSSGAVRMGMARFGMETRPNTMPELQAVAAAGQSWLMRAYEDALSCPVAQVLLTHSDLQDRERYLNARAAIDAALALDALPIVNENDVVSVEEMRFGDNDQLAAMLATLVGADLLILLTDVKGLLDGDGNVVSMVRTGEEEDQESVQQWLRPVTSDGGLGGMASKVDAARQASMHGIPVVIASAGEPTVLSKVLDGEDVGTLFLPEGTPLASRKHWIAYTLKMRGTLFVDDGAVRALTENGTSLLPVGVRSVSGDFDSGDPVSIADLGGREIARGLARYSTRDVARLAGAHSDEIELRIGYFGGSEVVHRDDLVMFSPQDLGA